MSQETGSNRRIRREVGRLYEDFQVGDIYEHTPGRTISPSSITRR